MKRGNAGASLRESINRTRKFVYDQRNPVKWNEGEREALIQSYIEQHGITKVPTGQSVWQTFFVEAASSPVIQRGWRHAQFKAGI